MRVLFGWELGAGLGHVNRMKPIARALAAEGAEILLALQEPERVSAFVDPATGRLPRGWQLLPIPKWNISTDPRLRQIPTHNFADVMRLIGFGNEEGFAARLEAWHGLLHVAKPDLAVGDFAPTMTLAARGRVPCLTVGNGYMTPPKGMAMPPIRPWQKQLEPFSREHEKGLFDMVNRVLARQGEPPVAHLADIFHGDRSFVVTVPIVDPYERFRKGESVPPFNLPTGIRPKPTVEREAGRVFFYMPRSHPMLKPVVEALRAAELPCDAYISDLPVASVEASSTPSFTVHPAPLPFDRVMPAARLVVHHGGLSTAIAATMAGTPQVIVPWNLEHLVTAKRIETLGATVTVNNPEKELPGKKLAKALAAWSRDDALLGRAIRLAETYRFGDPEEGLRKIVGACLEMLGRA